MALLLGEVVSPVILSEAKNPFANKRDVWANASNMTRQSNEAKKRQTSNKGTKYAEILRGNFKGYQSFEGVYIKYIERTKKRKFP